MARLKSIRNSHQYFCTIKLQSRLIFFFIIYFSVTTSVSAQKIYISQNTENITIRIQNKSDAIQYAKQNIYLLNKTNEDFMCIAEKKSPYATYYTLQQQVNGIPVYNSMIKISVLNSGRVKNIRGAYYNSAGWNISSNKIKTISLPQQLANTYNINTSVIPQPVIYADENNNAHIYYAFTTENPVDRSKTELILNGNGELITVNDFRSYYGGVDSTFSGKVFLPDPLSTAQVEYGGSYADNNDADNASLNSQRFAVTMKGTFSNDTFYLRNENINIKDFSPPNTMVAYSLTPNFYYTRSESGFEDVNTYYHITNFDNYIIAQGYAPLQNFYIEFDTHGASGADQSFFVAGTVPSIQFGEGGVDDAEDADVIIHEYSHALSNNASPESNSGFERRAVDEGYGDYFAASYSRSFTDHDWEKIFNWDGNNEFWAGRNANTDKHYPEDVGGDYYMAGEIWSSTLMDMYDAIGKENTDKLVFESLYGSILSMPMTDAGQIILSAEEIIFGGLYYDAVYNILDARGLILTNAVSQQSNENEIQINNSEGFSFRNEALYISLPHVETAVIKIYTADGNIVFDGVYENSDNIKLLPALTSNGIYLISVKTNDGFYTQKIMKLN